MTTFKVNPSPHPHTLQERQAALADLKFGQAFTDHMARAKWTIGRRVRVRGCPALPPRARPGRWLAPWHRARLRSYEVRRRRRRPWPGGLIGIARSRADSECARSGPAVARLAVMGAASAVRACMG